MSCVCLIWDIGFSYLLIFTTVHSNREYILQIEEGPTFILSTITYVS